MISQFNPLFARDHILISFKQLEDPWKLPFQNEEDKKQSLNPSILLEGSISHSSDPGTIYDFSLENDSYGYRVIFNWDEHIIPRDSKDISFENAVDALSKLCKKYFLSKNLPVKGVRIQQELPQIESLISESTSANSDTVADSRALISKVTFVPLHAVVGEVIHNTSFKHNSGIFTLWGKRTLYIDEIRKYDIDGQLCIASDLSDAIKGSSIKSTPEANVFSEISIGGKYGVFEFQNGSQVISITGFGYVTKEDKTEL